ncbi:MAG: response regulator [Dehalococcoidales bacterium]|nr:response regulator [Dehalococcoidales bacterium]
MTINCLRTGKVLLLEDEPVICRATGRTLAADGFHVDIAVNGLVAKDKVNNDDNYEFLILDIKTPMMNGMELYDYLLQEHPALADKVIFVTGDSLGAATKTFLDRVQRPCLDKPYTPTQLRTIIQEVFDFQESY